MGSFGSLSTVPQKTDRLIKLVLEAKKHEPRCIFEALERLQRDMEVPIEVFKNEGILICSLCDDLVEDRDVNKIAMEATQRDTEIALTNRSENVRMLL